MSATGPIPVKSLRRRLVRCWRKRTCDPQGGGPGLTPSRHEWLAFAAMHRLTCYTWPWGTPYEATRVHLVARWCGSNMAANGARSAAHEAADYRVPGWVDAFGPEQMGHLDVT
jgi:hypothetical protein